MGAKGDWIFGTICLVSAVVMLTRDFVPHSWIEWWKPYHWLSGDTRAPAVIRATRELKK